MLACVEEMKLEVKGHHDVYEYRCTVTQRARSHAPDPSRLTEVVKNTVQPLKSGFSVHCLICENFMHIMSIQEVNFVFCLFVCCPLTLFVVHG